MSLSRVVMTTTAAPFQARDALSLPCLSSLHCPTSELRRAVYSVALSSLLDICFECFVKSDSTFWIAVIE